MNSNRCNILRRLALLLLLPIALYACAPAPEQPPKTIKEAKKPARFKPTPTTPATPYYEADAYVKQLSLAKLALENNPADTDAVKPRLAIVRDFVSEGQTGGIYQPVIVISYSLKNKKQVEQVLAPFVMSEGNPGFPDLVEITAKLDTTKYTLHDVKPFVLTSLQGNSEIPMGNPVETQHVIDTELQRLLASKAELADIDEADVQLHLMQFFMQHHTRDAAYLAADNAQNSLAEAEDNGRDPEMIKSLSDQLDMLNGQLHKQMPFTLNAL